MISYAVCKDARRGLPVINGCWSTNGHGFMTQTRRRS